MTSSWLFAIAKTKANLRLFTFNLKLINYLRKYVYNIQEMHKSYKNPSPYIKVLQILQLQCLHFVDFVYFLKTLKETEDLVSVSNFAHTY